MSKTNEVNAQLRKDLMDAIKKCSDGSTWYVGQIWKRAVRMPAPRYYVTAKQAYQVLLPIVEGDFSGLEKMSPRRQRLYRSLYDKVLEMAGKPQYQGKSLWFLIPFAVGSPAPEFFVSEKWARLIYMEEMRGWRYKPVFKKKKLRVESLELRD